MVKFAIRQWLKNHESEWSISHMVKTTIIIHTLDSKRSRRSRPYSSMYEKIVFLLTQFYFKNK